MRDAKECQGRCDRFGDNGAAALPTRIRYVLAAAGLMTVAEVREISDEVLLSFQDLGKASVAHLRETLGLPSNDGVRP
jgi:DNA-directed RNA polymerase alpha subunit